jgi:uncharacterized protein YndB with AHSA1/START domain
MENLLATARTIVRKPMVEVFAAFADAGKMSRYWFTRKDDGLREGESVTLYMGTGDGAFSFDVQVKAVNPPHRIAWEWDGPDGTVTRVTFSFDETEDGDTILTVEESGFSGSDENMIERALDSTGGFNQVIIAAKAFIEHGVSVNVVADHAG